MPVHCLRSSYPETKSSRRLCARKFKMRKHSSPQSLRFFWTGGRRTKSSTLRRKWNEQLCGTGMGRFQYETALMARYRYGRMLESEKPQKPNLTHVWKFVWNVCLLHKIKELRWDFFNVTLKLNSKKKTTIFPSGKCLKTKDDLNPWFGLAAELVIFNFFKKKYCFNLFVPQQYEF